MMFWPLILILTLLTVLLMQLAKQFAVRYNVFIDHPNQRSSHAKPIPRCGGVIIALMFIVSILVLFRLNHPFVFAYILGALMIFVVGILDDLLNLRGYQKIFGMVLSAFLPIIFGLKLNYLGLINNNVYLLYFLSIIWIYGFINAFNFMDGIDGLIGGVSVIGAFFIFVLATIGGNSIVSTFALILFSVCLGFIVFNFSPASLFLGDSGSMFLGYNFALLGIILNNSSNNSIPIYVFLFIFAPIIFDSMLTFIKRGFEGKSVIQAHREHLYQRLIISGMTHRDVSLIYYALSLIFGLLGLLFIISNFVGRIGLSVLGFVIMIGFSFFVAKVELIAKGNIRG